MEFLLSTQGTSAAPMMTTDEVLAVLSGIFAYSKSDLFVMKLLQNWARFESLTTTCFKENNIACVAAIFQILDMVFSPLSRHQ